MDESRHKLLTIRTRVTGAVFDLEAKGLEPYVIREAIEHAVFQSPGPEWSMALLQPILNLVYK